MRGGRHQWNETQIFTDAGNFLQHFIKPVRCALLLELALHIGEHAAGHLRHQDARIHTAQAAFEGGVLLANLTKITGDTIQFFDIQPGVPVRAFQHGDHGFRGAMTIGHRHGRDGGVHVINARFCRFQGRGGGQPGGRVGLHVHGDIERSLKPFHQLESHRRPQQAGHVLNGNRMGAHLFDHFALLHPHVHGVHRADCVRDGALGVLALLHHSGDGPLNVAHVVHGIKHTEHIHAVFRCTFHKGIHHVIRVMAIAQQVLPPQQHLLRRFRHGLLQFADALPWVFAQITDTGIKGRAAPGFQ